MQRIYLPNTQFTDIFEVTEKQLYHQLTRVLRARINQEVVFFDGKNQEDNLYIMIHIDKKSVSFKKKEVIKKNSELGMILNLYQAQPNKLSKLEYIVQKCSEIGYSKIVFFESERSQKLVLSENKKERLRRIAIEAIEQCGGNIIPKIEFENNFSGEQEGHNLICHTSQSDIQKLSQVEVDSEKEVNICVGPEGGFSEEEIKLSEEFGHKKISFGERILRCETVGEVIGFYISQKK